MRIAVPLCTATFFILATFPSYAEECGKWLTTAHINKFVGPIEAATDNLMQMSQSLGKEAKAAFDVNSLQQSEKIMQEVSIASDIFEAQSNVKPYLDQALLLTLLKSQMVHPTDKVTVERYLSLTATAILKSSRLAQNHINRSLTRVNRPGLAVEATKLRDLLSDVSRSLDKCTAPAR